MAKILVAIMLLFPLFYLSPAPADVTAVSTEVEYESFINRVISLIALREELSGDVADEKSIGESGRVLHEIARIENELDMLGVDWKSFLPRKGKRAGTGGPPSPAGSFMRNTFYRPALHMANIPRHLRKAAGKTERATDVSAGGEVLDSALFINRDIDAYFPSDIARIDSMNRPRGRITVIKETEAGKIAGFLGEDEEGTPFLFRFDPPGMDEQVTGAEVIGSTIARLMGYNVPVSTILTVEGTGDGRFDGRRAAASRLVPAAAGTWSYYRFRDRREIRATMILAAWINNNGLVDHNTLVSSFAVGNVELCRYFMGGFGNSLGSAGKRRKRPKDGWEHSFDMGVIASTPLRLVLKPFGLWRERYSRRARPIDSAVGLFDANINPDLFEAEYPNMAWRHITTEDALWAVNLISRFTPAQIGAVVALASYRNPGDAEYIKNILIERQRKIMEHYLGKKVR